MENLRNKLYNEIEALETQLRTFDANEYGFSNDPEAAKISEAIDALEEQISETWTK